MMYNPYYTNLIFIQKQGNHMAIDIIIFLIVGCVGLGFMFVFLMPFIFIVGSLCNLYFKATGKQVGFKKSWQKALTKRTVKYKITQNVNTNIFKTKSHIARNRQTRLPEPKVMDYHRNNPSTGLPMAGRSSIDVGGNTFGTRKW